MFYHKGFVVKSVILFTLLLLYTSSTYSQRPVTGATLVSVPATPLTYTEDGNTYTWGQGNDLIKEDIQFNGETYFVENSFSQVAYVINRVSGNGGITYDRCGIFVDENTGNFNYASFFPGGIGGTGSTVFSMAKLLSEVIVNRGAINVFKNTRGTVLHMERIDISNNHFFIPNISNLNRVGFLSLEKDGNLDYKSISPFINKSNLIAFIDLSHYPINYEKKYIHV